MLVRFELSYSPNSSHLCIETEFEYLVLKSDFKEMF